MPKEFTLHYYVSNGGDGSASVNFVESAEKAEKLDEEQEEGWGESSADTVKLRVDKGKLYMQIYDWDNKQADGSYEKWIEIKP